MTAVIRELRSGDLAQVTALVVGVLSEFAFAAQAERVEADLADALARYAGHGGRFWVAEHESGIVGTVAVRPRDGDTCELKRLYLRPDQRGAGLGQRLYEHAERFAREAGYARIWLDSSRRFTKARALYERNGFVLLEDLDNEWEDSVYEKRLAPGDRFS